MPKLKKSEFQFRKHDSVGSADAEEDAFLSTCFYDSGDLEAARNPHNFKRIVLGRTGSGKTALLRMLAQSEENHVWLEPESLSLQYLSNSTILRFLSELGVNLDLFYRLLWKHIFAVELIKLRFRIKTEDDKRSFLHRIYGSFFGDKKKEKAVQYLTEWGEHFWKDTEYRIKEVTSKFESDINSKVGIDGKPLTAILGSSCKLTEEQKGEIVSRAQDVVNSIQIRDLGNVVKLLADEFLQETPPRYYIIIDRLDTTWVEDNVRYRLIRALIETIKDFAQIKSTKIIVAMRRDLLDRVVRLTRDAGFQEEKYADLYLPLQWTKDQLMSALDMRIQELVKRRYTKAPVELLDILPASVDKQPMDEYIVERTMYRPRDVILFINSCIESAIDRPSITEAVLRQAEAHYSRLRLRSLQDEWYADYPSLISFADLLKKRPPSFLAREISVPDVEAKCLDCATNAGQAADGMTQWAQKVAVDQMLPVEFRSKLLSVFYRVGLIGVKTETFTAVSWSFLGHSHVSAAEILEDTTIAVNPSFYSVLGIHRKQQIHGFPSEE